MQKLFFKSAILFFAPFIFFGGAFSAMAWNNSCVNAWNGAYACTPSSYPLPPPGYYSPYPPSYYQQPQSSPACVITSFSASSMYITPGTPVTLNWNTNGYCNSANISFVGPVNTYGNQTVYPSNNMIYTLSVYGAYSSDSRTMQIYVNQAQPNPASSVVSNNTSSSTAPNIVTVVLPPTSSTTSEVTTNKNTNTVAEKVTTVPVPQPEIPASAPVATDETNGLGASAFFSGAWIPHTTTGWILVGIAILIIALLGRIFYTRRKKNTPSFHMKPPTPPLHSDDSKNIH